MYVFIHVCMHVCIPEHVYLNVCMYLFVFIVFQVCLYVCLHVNTIWIHVRIYQHIYVCIHIQIQQNITQTHNIYTLTHTPRRGGTYENRTRIATEIVKRIREKVGADFIIIFRLSMLDLLEKGVCIYISCVRVCMYINTQTHA